MITQAEKVAAQAFVFGRMAKADYARHLIGPSELRKLLEAQEILKELIPHAESMGKFCEDYGPVSEASEKVESLIRRAKEVV